VNRPPLGPRVDAWRRALGLTGLVVALDQAGKAVAVSALVPGESARLALGFELTNIRNRGVAFGLLANGRTGVILITAAATTLMLAYFALHPTRGSLWAATGLLAGGAIGNLADRVRIDAVIDYFDPPFWPAFNLADVSIVAGVVVLVMTLPSGDGDGGPA
jgi:signal peptidase II